MPGVILIVASDPNIIYLLQRYAEKAGFQTVEANQGKDLTELAQQTTPALIILENDFPGMVDRTVLHRLKDVVTTRAIPVVVYSCLDEAVKPVEGVTGFLRKSVRYDDFLVVLKQSGVLS